MQHFSLQIRGDGYVLQLKAAVITLEMGNGCSGDGHVLQLKVSMITWEIDAAVMGTCYN